MSQQLAPAPIGIDIGTYKSKIAVAKRGGVEVITNEANFRQTPCVVGFGSQQRQIGQSGNIKMKSNFKDTIVSPMRFLGLQQQYPLLRAQTRFSPCKSNLNDGRLKFDVNYQGEKLSILPEQAMAAYFNKLKLIIAKNGLQNKQVIISVPTYLTQSERKAYLDAAKIAELNLVRLVNDSTAVGLDYGLFRKADLDAEKLRNVLFIDFGHSKLGVFACSFTKTQMNVLEQQYARNLGCRDIDYLLYEFYRNQFEKTSGGLDLSESKKAYVKLMQVIERQRKILSGNLQHDLNIQYLMEQYDLNYTMTREQFEKITQPIFQEVQRVLVKVRDDLKAKDIQLHSIELIGGGTRIPIFNQAVKEVFGIEPSRTLNSSESVARGCALEAAIKSPLFRVQQYTLNERVYNGVKFFWNFVQNNNYLGLDSTKYPQAQAKMIYDYGAKVPSSKTIKFKRREPIEILIEYEPSVNGFSKHIGYYKTPAQNPQHENFGVSFKIKYTESGLITFEECALVEEWTEQTKIPKKKEAAKTQAKTQAKTDKKQPTKAEKKEAAKNQKKQAQAPKEGTAMQQQQFQIKKTKKQQHHPIKFESNQFPANTAEQLQKYFTLESEMLNKDRIILETYEKKNELQSLSYKWKQNLNGSYKDYAKPEDIPDIIKLLEENSQWLYNQGQSATRGAYAERVDKVNAKIVPIKNRHDNLQLINDELSTFYKCLDTNTQALKSQEKKHEHITPEQRQQSYNFIQKTRAWMTSNQQKQTQRKKYEEAVTSLNEIRNKMKQVTENVRKTMNKPAPKPEPKKEQKAQKMDVEPTAQTPAEKQTQTAPNTQGAQKMQTQ